MRIAVLGLYNSGSSVLAGMLHRLGVHMAPPFWGDFYEPYELSWHLRNWWNEPHLCESTAPEHRVCFLRHWIELQESTAEGYVGAKHPLLSLCGPDLLAAWGADVRFIWSYRSLEDSIRGLKRRNWFPGHEDRVQRHLWDALEAFERSHVALFKIDWLRVKANPQRGARELAQAAGLEPTDAQLDAAAGIVRPSAAAHRRAVRLGRRLYSSVRASLTPITGARPLRRI